MQRAQQTVGQAVIARVLALLALLVAPAVFAQSSVSSDSAFGRFMMTTTGAGQTTASFGSNGTPVASPSSFTMATDGGSGIKTTTSGSFRNPSGNYVPVEATARAPNAGIAGAIGRFAMKVVTPISIGYALYDLARELGFELTNNADGTLRYQRIDPDVGWCSVGPCYEWQAGPGAWMPTIVGGCMAGAAQATANSSTHDYTYVGYDPTPNSNYPYGRCIVNYKLRATGGNENLTMIVTRRGRTPDTGTPPYLPSSWQQFVDEIANKSGWPATSNLARAAKQAAEANPEVLPTDPPTVEGPATSPGTDRKTTTQNPDGSTRTEDTKCTWHHTYSGANVSSKEVCVTTVTNDGEAGKTATKTEESKPAGGTMEKPKDPCGLPGTPACKIDETGTPEAPEKKPDEDVPRVLKPLQDFATDPSSKLPTFPTLNWAFRLPSGCAPLAIPAFEPFLQTIDVCQFMPIFHDIMSIVWIMGGIFGAISMFWRSVFAAH